MMADVMTGDVVTVSPHASVADAAAAMKSHDVPLLAVCSGQRVVGVLTARAVADCLAAHGPQAASTIVERVMTTAPILCRQDADLKEAARLMLKNRIRRILVVDAAGALVGTATMDAIAYVLATGAAPASHASHGQGI